MVYQDRIQPWDILAGALLVQEAGGVATDFHGAPVSTHSQGIVAAARVEFHQAVLEAIHNLKPS
jgi:myo-inositol-1(or 4)-monophosphatase